MGIFEKFSHQTNREKHWHETLAVALAVMFSLSLANLTSANEDSGINSRNVERPDAAIEADGGTRDVEPPVVSVGPEGVSLGVGAPTETPGSDSQPLPKFSGVSAPVWVNAEGPTQIADDTIFHGLTDLKIGFVNTGEISARPMPIRIPGGEAPLPDIIVNTPITYTPTGADTPRWGMLMSFTGIVKNNGNAASGTTNTRLRIDLNSDGTWDTVEKTVSTGALAADATETETFSDAWAAKPGTHVVEMCADSDGIVTESNETNNCTALSLHVYGSDLIVESADVSPPNPETNQTVTFSGSVKNAGTYWSTNSTTKVFIDEAPVGPSSYAPLLSVNQSSVQEFTFSLSSVPSLTAGTHQFKICADFGNVNEELDEINNCSVPQSFEVVAPPPPYLNLSNSNTPAAHSINPGTLDHTATIINFSANRADITITGITVERTGTAADSAITNIKLADVTNGSPGTPVGSTVASLTGSHQAVFTGLSWAVPVGTIKKLSIIADIPTSAENQGGTYFELKIAAMTTASATDVINNLNLATGYSINIRPTLKLTLDATSPSGNFASGGTASTATKIRFEVFGAAVTVSSFTVGKSGTIPDASFGAISLVGTSLVPSGTGTLSSGSTTIGTTSSWTISPGAANAKVLNIKTIVGAPTVAPANFSLNLTALNSTDAYITGLPVNGNTLTVPDATAPTGVSVSASPTGPTYTTAQTITLTGTASDNVGIAKIEFYDGATLKGTDTSSPYSYGWAITTTDNGTHNWTAKAYDATNNATTSSALSLTVNVPDTTAPTAPTLTASSTSATEINLTWSGATDNVGVTGYQIQRCTGSGCTPSTQIATSTSSPHSNTGLTPSTTYVYRIRAVDAAGNAGAFSANVSATTSADTTAPTAPTGLTATAASATQINLSWTASTDNVAVTGYKIERCTGASCTPSTQIDTVVTGTTYNNTGLTDVTAYRYRIRAYDAAVNNSGYSSTVNATTPDGTAPTAPTGLTATAASATQINLSWTASTDNVAVTSYKIERCANAGCTNFSQIATATGTTYNNTGVSTGTTYQYRVRANDAANNLSGYSGIVSAVAGANFATPTITDTTVVLSNLMISTVLINDGTISTGVTSTAGLWIDTTSGQATISQSVPALAVGASFQLTFSVSTPSNGSHTYRVCADTGTSPGVVQESDESDNCFDGTFYIGAPTAPGTPTATASCTRGQNQINLAWSGSTGATEYRIYRCTGTGCSPATEIATDTASPYINAPLSNNTTYRYKLRAYNATTDQYSSATSTVGATTPSLCAAANGTAQTDLFSFLDLDASFLQTSVLTDPIGTDFLSSEAGAPFATSSFSTGIPIASASSHTTGIAIGGTADVPFLTLYNPVTIYDDLYIYGNDGLAGVPAESGNMAIAGRLYAQNGIHTSLIQGGSLNIQGTAQIFGDLRVLAGSATFDGDLKVYGNLGRFYEQVSTAVSATSAAFAETSTACDGSDTLWSCTAEFGADPDAGSSYSWFPVTDFGTGRCTVKAKVSGGSAKPVNAQAVCFSPDG